jgi:hypothetical protein
LRVNSARSSTSNARCIRSGCTCTGGAPGGIWQISISSSLFGVARNTICAPRGEVLRRATFSSSACPVEFHGALDIVHAHPGVEKFFDHAPSLPGPTPTAIQLKLFRGISG